VDAYLTAQARDSFAALSALAPGRPLMGLLLGHTRGHRFVVERILPAPPGIAPDERSLTRIDAAFAGRIIGFFVAGDSARIKASLRRPSAAGRLLLIVKTSKRGPSFKAVAVDFDGRIRFVPLPVHCDEAAP
jgi:hypothetical protein